MPVPNLLLLILPGVSSVFFIAAGLSSFLEKETRAGLILTLFGLIIIVFLALTSFMDLISEELKFILIIAIYGISALFLLPIKGRLNKFEQGTPTERFNEADAVLSRRLLKPGTKEYISYYEQNPGYREADDQARGKPGLLSEGSKFFDAGTFAAARANFILTDHLHALDGLAVTKEQIPLDARKTTAFIKSWLTRTGAHSVGFTSLEEHHLYSHKGRGPRRGEKIKKEHIQAIAITVEMDHLMLRHAPEGPTVMESAEQYLRSGVLASKLAAFIKDLGYSASAHIDGHYELICPLVAADAGLGVVGRMGLLMTPDLGPRVRIAVVTTDLPLINLEKKKDLSTLAFCNICKKCARACPVQAIPFGEMTRIEGAQRWRISSEACYHFWTISGTDCGQCMIACPYSHPDSWFHRFIRWGIKNNLFFRVMASKLDDVFYGRKPKKLRFPNLQSIKQEE